MYQKNFSKHKYFHRRRGGQSQVRRKQGGGEYIHPERFVNKASVVKAEHFVPKHRFDDFAIADVLKRSVIAKGYTIPTPIQDQAISHILLNQDVVGIANTGTGKTAAFLIPLINKVLKNPNEQVLIIVPTRELALQIEEELRSFVRGMSIFSVVCVGGSSIVPQIRALKYRNHFVIGTPGRLKDLIGRKCIDRSRYSTIVLDEADRMLDMGFINDMRFVMNGMPSTRQTLFFSATISPEIEKLISQFLRQPVRITVKTNETAKNIDQDVVKIAPGIAKLDVLHKLLNQNGFSKVLVFGRTKRGVEKLSKALVNRGIMAASIHGNKSQSQRQRSLAEFKNNKVKVLVATDVAARGLDIDNVSHVINYDLPTTYSDYVHRIGRTGRAGARGRALTFIE